MDHSWVHIRLFCNLLVVFFTVKSLYIIMDKQNTFVAMNKIEKMSSLFNYIIRVGINIDVYRMELRGSLKIQIKQSQASLKEQLTNLVIT